jgi:hypothetical protein
MYLTKNSTNQKKNKYVTIQIPDIKSVKLDPINKKKQTKSEYLSSYGLEEPGEILIQKILDLNYHCNNDDLSLDMSQENLEKRQNNARIDKKLEPYKRIPKYIHKQVFKVKLFDNYDAIQYDRLIRHDHFS